MDNIIYQQIEINLGDKSDRSKKDKKKKKEKEKKRRKKEKEEEKKKEKEKKEEKEKEEEIAGDNLYPKFPRTRSIFNLSDKLFSDNLMGIKFPLNISWSLDSLLAISDIANRLNRFQWKLLQRRMPYTLSTVNEINFLSILKNSSDESLLIRKRQLLIEICNYRIFIINTGRIKWSLFNKYANFQYLEGVIINKPNQQNLSDYNLVPDYKFTKERVYSCVAHLLLLDNLETCKFSQYPNYVGSYIVGVVADLLQSEYDCISLALWITRSLLYEANNNFFRWNEVDSIMMIILDTNLSILGDITTISELSVISDIKKGLSSDWVNLKNIKLNHIKFFIGLCYFISRNKYIEQWIISSHIVNSEHEFKEFLQNPLIAALTVISSFMDFK